MSLRDLEPSDREMELQERLYPAPSLLRDLGKDKKSLYEYTLEWVITIELLLENHLSELVALEKYLDKPDELNKHWERTKFCRACVVAHSLELKGYSSECITGACPSESEWKDLQNLGSEMYKFFKPFKRIEDFTKEVFEKAKEFRTKLRNIRKILTEEDSRNVEEFIT